MYKCYIIKYLLNRTDIIKGLKFHFFFFVNLGGGHKQIC